MTYIKIDKKKWLERAVFLSDMDPKRGLTPAQAEAKFYELAERWELVEEEEPQAR